MSLPTFVVLEGLQDDYDQIQKMAIGGMAEIFRGRQRSLDRPVAIKRIRPEIKGNQEILARFRREARISAALLHQNLAHVYDYREVAGEAYIIMEYIDGFDLAQILEKQRQLPIDVATVVALKILLGLAQVHAHGMVHRDLKPDNVRISTKGEVKVMDFGITYDPAESNLTMPGVLIGSPHYLSPEQIVGAKLDARADLFAFGISFYEMITGQKPFMETRDETVYQVIQKGKYVPIMHLRADTPPFIANLIDSCLATQVGRRPNSANRLAVTLQEYATRHFALAHEARIKQFLMQTHMLAGMADMVEVEERTMDPSVTHRIREKWNVWKGAFFAMAAVAAMLAAVNFFPRLFNMKEVQTVEVDTRSPDSKLAPESRTKPSSKAARREKNRR
ncbi:MAG TPA: serine/threonine-protein kinase [Bdellovibrionota bacterium]|jgi:serine/threonine protein kinase|nr:serine/threonine-protein kinase [Bdellovibrionota bacterium]